MFFTKPVVITLLFAIGLCLAEDNTIENSSKSDRSEFKKSFARECATSYSVTCLKLDIVSWVDKLSENEEMSVLPGVSLVKENASAGANTGDIVADLARKFPNDPDARLDAYLMKKVSGFLNNHSLKLNLWNTANAVEEGRGKGGGGGGGGGGKKGGGGMEYLLAAGAMMKATLMAVGMGGIAAIAGKALMVGLISLMLSAIIGIKSLSHGGGGSTTYEIVAKPIYSHANTHSVSHEEHGGGGGGHYGHSSYARSLDVPLPIGLQPNYKPKP